jgi:hypothetical protein
MLHIAEITAAPHFPEAMRPAVQGHALSDFLRAMNGDGALAIVEENGELRLVSIPNS